MNNFYVTGGTLRYDAPSSVERQADKDLCEGLIEGEFCYVLTSRQMGKSSLMVRTANNLRQQAISVVALDLTAIGQNLTPEQWYDGLVVRMGRQLRLENDLENFWLDNERLGPVQRLFTAFREVVIPNRNGPLVIFVDEIDTVRSLPFSTGEFFAAIREFYNRRSEDAELNRLTFCLLGVATPSDLIRDTRITPFNIGRRIELNDFTMEEAGGLAKGLSRAEEESQLLLERIFYWTNGHPYLTQRLCQAITDDPTINEAEEVDRLCEELFLSNRARERDDNLLFVRERLLRSEADLNQLLGLYEKIRSRQRVRDDESNPLIDILRLSGITRVEKGYLVVRNRIYQRVFDRDWVKANMPVKEPEPRSIAVLPFVNLSPDSKNEYLSDGLTEELIDALGQVPGLRVASRTSAFKFKGKADDVRKIASRLNVKIILEGTVRRVGDRIRISAQIVSASDGYRLWSETYKYDLKDLSIIQEEIASAIVERLKSELGYQPPLPPVKRYTQNLAAYNLYLKGRYYWNKRTKEAVRRSVGLFEEAIATDPHYALAYAGLADAYSMLGTYNYLPPVEAYPQAKTAAQKALELDDYLAQAHCALACGSALHDWDWERAEREFKRAIELNPSYATAHQWYAINCLTPLGRHDAAIVELRQAQDVDPLSISINASVGLAYYFAAQYEEALAQCRQTIEMDPNFWLTHLFLGWGYLETSRFQEAIGAFQAALERCDSDPVALAALGYAYAAAGKKSDALDLIDQLLILSKSRYVPASEIAVIYLALGDFERALTWLDKAYLERSFRLIYLKVDPRFKSIWSHPKYLILLGKLGLEKAVSA